MSEDIPNTREARSVDERVLRGDDRLNDTCTASFEVPGYVSFHFKPVAPPGRDMSLVIKEFRNYRSALGELARRLEAAKDGDPAYNKYSSIRYVAVTSWIIENNEPILARSGFADDPTMDAAERAELIRVYESRQPTDGVLPQHRAIAPKCLRVSVDEFIRTQK